jgi:hypothetical protein
MKYHHLFITICLFFSISNLGYASEFGPFQGQILDTETKEPIEGVVVLIEWSQYRLSSLFENTIFYDAQETLTDKNGEFYMSGIWVLNPWTRLMLDTDVMVYKSGYEAIALGSWKGRLEAKSWRQPAELKGYSRGSYIFKVEDGKPVIMLKKLTMDERKKVSPPSRPSIPIEKMKLLTKEVNKERLEQGVTPFELGGD